MSDYLEHRRRTTDIRLDRLRADLATAEMLAGGRACVYLTGSFARGEAGSHSDLDLFIMGKGTKTSPALRRLDEICVKADLIEATRKHEIPDFSRDGEYLVHYTEDELIETLGSQQDDACNTFTARLLLLLESRALIGEAVYHDTIQAVVAAYWGEFEDHKRDFVPAFLVNDILRLWRTFCVNYEARTKNSPPEKKAKRKLANYKLKQPPPDLLLRAGLPPRGLRRKGVRQSSGRDRYGAPEPHPASRVAANRARRRRHGQEQGR